MLFQPRAITRTLVAGVLVCCCSTSSAESAGAAGVQYGHFEISRTTAQLAELVASESVLEPLDADDTVTWRVYVPESYDSSEPAGLMVYISPTTSGGLPVNWRPVIDAENMIWIGADKSGNRTPTRERILFATLAPYLVSELYAIDSDRVYLSGFSGGGKAAGIASIHLADLFTGAIFICGAEWWADVQPEQLARAVANRYVFVTGSRDFNRSLTKRIYRQFGRAGLIHSRLMIIPGMDHSRPRQEDFREAVRYLDHRE